MRKGCSAFILAVTVWATLCIAVKEAFSYEVNGLHPINPVFSYDPTGSNIDAGALVAEGVNAWNDITRSLTVRLTSASGAANLCDTGKLDGYNTISWGYNTLGYLAITCWNLRTGECDILISPNYEPADLRQIVAHEIGHCLGLNHSADSNALMWPTVPLNAPPVLLPQADDRNGVCAIYGGCYRAYTSVSYDN